MPGSRSPRSALASQRTHRTQARRHGRGGARKWIARLAVAAVLAIAALLAWAWLARKFAPIGDTSATHFDAIVVLGYPANRDGDPTPNELASVTEAVREYERGVAPRLIFTGAAVANQFTEARVMARAAEAQGIPAADVATETDARNTIQNACYAERIMKAHGWQSAEVIANPIHLPRASILFSTMPLEWRMHAAPPLGPVTPLDAAVGTAWETLKTVHYLVWSREMEACQP